VAKLKDFTFMQSAFDICRNNYINEEALQCYFSTHDTQSAEL